jgi:hypothetical protein
MLCIAAAAGTEHYGAQVTGYKLRATPSLGQCGDCGDRMFRASCRRGATISGRSAECAVCRALLVRSQHTHEYTATSRTD